MIPVNLTEAYVMSPRIDPKNRRHTNFPFVSVIATSDHTEIVLSRGVGLHTILGMSVDLNLNLFLERCCADALKRKDLLENKDQINAHIKSYNELYPND